MDKRFIADVTGVIRFESELEKEPKSKRVESEEFITLSKALDNEATGFVPALNL